MSSRATINQVLHVFCTENGVPPFALDGDGLACLQLQDGRQVFLVHTEDEDRLFAATELRKLPEEPALRLLLVQIAMGMNFLQQGLGPTTLALKARGLFCQCELAMEGLTAETLGLGMALTLEHGKLVGEALGEAIRAASEGRADVG